MDDKEYELLKESIERLWKSIEELKVEVKGIREEIKESTERSTESLVQFNGLCKDFSTFKEIHNSEHNIMWGEIRNLKNKPEENKKQVGGWLDITWKIILITGAIITTFTIVIMALHNMGLIK